MAIAGYLTRDTSVVWRDIAGEIVIADGDSAKVHVLNKTASLIWTLADGTRQVEDMAADICNRFEVTPEQARADAEEFCHQLLEAQLVSLREVPQET